MKMKWKHVKEGGVNVAIVSNKGYRIDKIFNVQHPSRRYAVMRPRLNRKYRAFVKQISYAASSADAVTMCNTDYNGWLSASGGMH